jgi:peptidylprolyl isomerase
MSVNRVQDNYVAQWGDPNADDKVKAKALPAGLATMAESDYTLSAESQIYERSRSRLLRQARPDFVPMPGEHRQGYWHTARDPYTNGGATFDGGWPIAYDGNNMWPVHCYGMVGVGRDLSPNTGSGAELYVVIGHAPRHLDRNIALVGRVIEGIEYLSSLPRGHGALGFVDPAQGDERTPILSIHPGSEVAGLPAYEYLSTESASFAKYADARANRKDAFFIRPAGGADICNIPVPVRRVK